MEWLNEPASWQRTGDVLTVSVDPGTDFWRETGYGYIRDSGHVYGEVLAGDLDVSVRLRGVLEAQYDQAGVMIRADEQTWIKTGVEYFEGRPRLSTVLTLGKSSWMVTDLPEGTDEIVLQVSRRGDAVEVRYVIGDGTPELAALVYMPPGQQVLAGVMCAAPEGPGFRVWFHDLQVTEPDWSGPEGPEAGSWSGGAETAWTGDETGQRDWAGEGAEPGWTGEARTDPGWTGEESTGAGWTGEEHSDRTWAADDQAPAAGPAPGSSREPAATDRPERPERPERSGEGIGRDRPERPERSGEGDRRDRPVDTGDDPIWQRDKDDDPDWARELAKAVGDTDWPGNRPPDDEPDRPEGGSADDGPGRAGAPAKPGGSGRQESAAKPAGTGEFESLGEFESVGESAGSGELTGSGFAGSGEFDGPGEFEGLAEFEDSGEPDGTGPADTSGDATGGRGKPGRGEPGHGDPAPAESGGRVRSALARLGLAASDSAKPDGPDGGEASRPDGGEASRPADGEPTRPAGGEPTRSAGPEDLGRRDSDFQAWSPAPTLGSRSWFEPTVADTPAGTAPSTWTPPGDPDAAADWDRLAAGVQAATSRFGAVAERWTAQTDVDVANEWPGPPLRAARQAAILNGWNAEPPARPAEAGHDQNPLGQARTAQGGPVQGGPVQAGQVQAGSVQADTEPEPRQAPPDPAGATAEAEPPGGQADQDRPGTGRRPARPPLDVPAPPDPADEWISLLTADPAEE